MKRLNKQYKQLKDPMSDNRLKKASEETKELLKKLLKEAEEKNNETETKQIELSDMMLNIARIKEPIIKDIENVGFDRTEIEKCFEKLVRKGLGDMSNKEIKQAIILELTKPKGKVRRVNKPTQEEMLQAITQ